MVQKPTIPHFKSKIVDNVFLEEQRCGNLMGLPRPFFLKKSLFYKLCAWQAPNNAKPFFFRNFNVHYQGFKMRYCLFLYYKQFLNYSLKCMKNSTSILLLVRSNWSYLYVLSLLLAFYFHKSPLYGKKKACKTDTNQIRCLSHTSL